MLPAGDHLAVLDLEHDAAVRVEALAVALAKRGVALSFRLTDEARPVWADRVQLQQAVHNLIINGAEAIQSVGRTGMVVVEAKCRDGHDWLIEVRDDGPGFPPGYNLLDPTPFTSTKSDGSGIGLAVVRSIAEAHGGSLVIRSTARGSRVAITLPGMEPAHD